MGFLSPLPGRHYFFNKYQNQVNIFKTTIIATLNGLIFAQKLSDTLCPVPVEQK